MCFDSDLSPPVRRGRWGLEEEDGEGVTLISSDLEKQAVTEDDGDGLQRKQQQKRRKKEVF